MTRVDSVPVLFNDILSLLAIRSFSGCLHVFYGVLERNNVGELEECRLKNSIYPCSHSGFFAQLNAVDCIEIDIILRKVSLYLTGKVLFKTVHIPDSVEKEGSSRLNVGNHIVFINIALIMTCDKISFINKVS